MSLPEILPSDLHLDSLTEAEQNAIFDVLRRDMELRRQESERIRILRAEVNQLQTLATQSERFGNNEKVCLLCRVEFGWLFNRGDTCPHCWTKVCDKCRQTVTTKYKWLCTLCFKQMELKARSGAWFYSKFRRSRRKTRENGMHGKREDTPDPFARTRYSNAAYLNGKSADKPELYFTKLEEKRDIACLQEQFSLSTEKNNSLESVIYPEDADRKLLDELLAKKGHSDVSSTSDSNVNEGLFVYKQNALNSRGVNFESEGFQAPDTMNLNSSCKNAGQSGTLDHSQLDSSEKSLRISLPSPDSSRQMSDTRQQNVTETIAPSAKDERNHLPKFNLAHGRMYQPTNRPTPDDKDELMKMPVAQSQSPRLSCSSEGFPSGRTSKSPKSQVPEIHIVAPVDRNLRSNGSRSEPYSVPLNPAIDSEHKNTNSLQSAFLLNCLPGQNALLSINRRAEEDETDSQKLYKSAGLNGTKSESLQKKKSTPRSKPLVPAPQNLVWYSDDDDDDSLSVISEETAMEFDHDSSIGKPNMSHICARDHNCEELRLEDVSEVVKREPVISLISDNDLDLLITQLAYDEVMLNAEGRIDQEDWFDVITEKNQKMLCGAGNENLQRSKGTARKTCDKTFAKANPGENLRSTISQTEKIPSGKMPAIETLAEQKASEHCALDMKEKSNRLEALCKFPGDDCMVQHHATESHEADSSPIMLSRKIATSEVGKREQFVNAAKAKLPHEAGFRTDRTHIRNAEIMTTEQDAGDPLSDIGSEINYSVSSNEDIRIAEDTSNSVKDDLNMHNKEVLNPRLDKVDVKTEIGLLSEVESSKCFSKPFNLKHSSTLSDSLSLLVNEELEHVGVADDLEAEISASAAYNEVFLSELDPDLNLSEFYRKQQCTEQNIPKAVASKASLQLLEHDLALGRTGKIDLKAVRRQLQIGKRGSGDVLHSHSALQNKIALQEVLLLNKKENSLPPDKTKMNHLEFSPPSCALTKEDNISVSRSDQTYRHSSDVDSDECTITNSAFSKAINNEKDPSCLSYDRDSLGFDDSSNSQETFIIPPVLTANTATSEDEISEPLDSSFHESSSTPGTPREPVPILDEVTDVLCFTKICKSAAGAKVKLHKAVECIIPFETLPEEDWTPTQEVCVTATISYTPETTFLAKVVTTDLGPPPENLVLTALRQQVTLQRTELPEDSASNGEVLSGKDRVSSILIVCQHEENADENAEVLTDIPAVTTPDSLRVRSPLDKKSLSSLSAISQDSIASIHSSPGKGRLGRLTVTGEIELSIKYNDRLSTLEVFIRQCRGLAMADAKKKRSDPYVKTYLLPDKSKSSKRKTVVKKNTVDPIYNALLKYPVEKNDLERRLLWVSIWHYDRFGRNDFLGDVVITLNCEILSNPEPHWYSLEQEAGVKWKSVLSLTSKADLDLALKYVTADRTVSKIKGKQKKPYGELIVTVKMAHNLSPMLGSNLISPFCRCRFLSEQSQHEKQKTRVVKNTLNPTWNHTFVFTGVIFEDLSASGLELTVWDYEQLKSADFLGGLCLNLGSSATRPPGREWMNATEEEVSVWKNMMEHPNEWIETIIELRSSLE